MLIVILHIGAIQLNSASYQSCHATGHHRWEEGGRAIEEHRDLTTGTWQDDTGCPIDINLGCTSDAHKRLEMLNVVDAL
jgi:hypothetical protein